MMTNKATWEGELDVTESWRLTLDTDVLTPDGNYVVVIEADYVDHDDDGLSLSALLAPTPEQADEIAATLVQYAERARIANERIRELKVEHE